MQVVGCGYGHKIIDGDEIIYTSQEAMAADIIRIIKMFDKSVELLSILIGIPSEYIIHDLYEISGCDMMREAFNAVLAKQGKDGYIPTLTETAFDYTVDKLNIKDDKEN